MYVIEYIKLCLNFHFVQWEIFYILIETIGKTDAKWYMLLFLVENLLMYLLYVKNIGCITYVENINAYCFSENAKE
jgi:hypothetical protein